MIWKRHIFERKKGEIGYEKKDTWQKTGCPSGISFCGGSIEWCRIWLFSTRFGRCIHGSISLFFSLFFSSPLKSEQWWGWHVCGVPHRRILCRTQWLALAISSCPITTISYLSFFSFSFCSLASLVRYMPSLVINTSKPWLVNIQRAKKKPPSFYLFVILCFNLCTLKPS